MKHKIALAFILAVVALGLVGFMGRNTISNLIYSIQKASQPDKKSKILDKLLLDLAEADNSVRTYAITNDDEDLTVFYQAAAKVEDTQWWLKSNTTAEDIHFIDSLNQLVNLKFETLKQLIEIQRSSNMPSALSRVSVNIDKVADSIAEPEEKKQSFLKRLFKPEEKQQDTAQTRKIIKDINQVIDKARVEEARNNLTLKSKKLGLTTSDLQLSSSIKNIVSKIKESHNDRAASQAEAAQNATNKAIRVTNVIGISGLILFGVLLSIIFRDIDRNRRNREQLKIAKEQAENHARAKQEFLANMSHEIRSPLNAIIGFSEQLQETPLDRLQKNHLNYIVSSGRHLLQIVNDILDYSKLEQGKMTFEHVGFMPKKMVREVISSYRAQLDNDEVKLIYKFDACVPGVIIGDPIRFRQILINLISNAIKFTKKGFIKTTLHWANGSSKISQLKLSVSDTGVGIPQEKLEAIFQDFSQADSSTTREFGGTGLGLAIVKKIAYTMGGKIDVTSKLKEGTTFTVSIPVTPGTPDDLPETDKSQLYNQLRGRKILVVDDQEYNLELLKAIFNKWGVDGTYASSGKASLRLFQNNTFDVILMDLQMPDLSGFETAKKIREIEDGPKTPIIALSAAMLDEQTTEIQKAGLNDWLPKPFTRQSLYQKLLQTLEPGSITVKPEPTLAPDESDLNMEELYKLANGDSNFVVEMLNLFMKNFEKDFDKLQMAWKNKNWKMVSDKAHKMCAPVNHLGLKPIYKQLKSIENEALDRPSARKLFDRIKRVEKSYKRIKLRLLNEVNNAKTKLKTI